MKDKGSRVAVSVIIPIAIVFIAFYIGGLCPESESGLAAINGTFFGNLCAGGWGIFGPNQNPPGWSGIGLILLAPWIIVIESALNYAILSPETRSLIKYISLVAITSIAVFICFASI
jgi:hypothetical protein